MRSVLAGGSSSVSSSVSSVSSSSSLLRLSSPSSSLEGLGAMGGARRWMMSEAGSNGGDKKKAEAEGEAPGAEEGKVCVLWVAAVPCFFLGVWEFWGSGLIDLSVESSSRLCMAIYGPGRRVVGTVS